MKKANLRWCAEEDEYIDIDKCDGKKDCACWCDESTGFMPTDNEVKAIVSYDRSLPEEDEPTTYIRIDKKDKFHLPFILSEVLAKNPHDSVYLIFENITFKEQPDDR